MQTVYFKKLHQDAEIPDYKEENDVLADIKTIENGVIKANESKVFKTGLAPSNLPHNLELQIRTNKKLVADGIIVLDSPSSISSEDDDKEILITLHNVGKKDYSVTRLSTIASVFIGEAPVVKLKYKKG